MEKYSSAHVNTLNKNDPSNSKASFFSADKSIKSERSGRLHKLPRKEGSPTSTLSKITEEETQTSVNVHCSCERLDNELRQFIDDFIESKEYEDYVNFKKSIIKKDDATQYDINDLDVEKDDAEVISKRKPDKLRSLTRKALRLFFLEMQVKKYTENRINAEVVIKQREAIQLIKRKLAEAKRSFFCHKMERELRTKRKNEAIIDNFITKYNIDVSRLTSHKRLGNIILDVERKRKLKEKTLDKNKNKVLSKLIEENKQNRIRCKKKKRFWRRRNVVEKNSSRIFYLGGKQSSKNLILGVRKSDKEGRIVKLLREANVCKVENDFETMPKEELDVLSMVQCEDNVYQILLDDHAKKKLGVAESFVQFEDLLEARHFFCLCEREKRDRENLRLAYPDDVALVHEPRQIIISNFRGGRVYRKKITLINRSGSTVKIRFHKTQCEDDLIATYFTMEPDGLKVVLPGLSSKFFIKFCPIKDAGTIHCSLIFLICHKATYYKHIVPLKCIPSLSDVIIDPEKVNFGSIPVWTILKKSNEISKTLKIRAGTNDAHKIILRRILDPLELEYPSRRGSSTPSDEVGMSTQDQSEVRQILEDLLDEMECVFRPETWFLVIGGSNKKEVNSLRMTVANLRQTGYYIEKYRVDVYRVGEDEDEYKGMQELTCTLEVTDHFIKFGMSCVDFGICFYGSAYQISFEVTNTSHITQPISIRIPSLLRFYVWTDENNTCIRPGETRGIILKLLPSKDLLREKNKYFDPATCILYFPVEIKLLNKQYANVPPLTQHAYAILNDCSDLILDPKHRDRFEMVDGRMVLDLDECSINETVLTEVVLRNTSYSTRFYGFPDLPRYVTIWPNYGFGSIHAFQEINLKIYIHPQIEDLGKEGMYPYGRAEKNSLIFVETVGNVGKYRRKPDMRRLPKLLRAMLNELKRVGTSSLIRDMSECALLIKLDLEGLVLENATQTECAEPTEVKDSLEEITLTQIDVASTVGPQSSDDTSASPIVVESSESRPKRKKKKKSLSNVASKHKSSLKGSSTAETSMKRGKTSKLKTIREASVPASETPSLLQKKDIHLTTSEADLHNSPIEICSNATENNNENLSRELRLRMTFTKPQYEFSYNYIEFPATPGSSFSTMTTELRPLMNMGSNCCCGFADDKKQPNFTANFRIAGSSDEIKIEPVCGTLRKGESIKLTLIATPKIKEELVAASAYERRKSSLVKQKLAHEVRKRKEESILKNKSKPKLPQAPPIETEDDIITVDVESEEVEVSFFDYYPAELTLWRSIEPYFLYGHFICQVEYNTGDKNSSIMVLPPDRFALEAVCKVIPPDFIHDQKIQQIDFGQVFIGTSKRLIITVQNLKYHDIVVRSSILRPHGDFTCPNFDSVALPSENFLKIPITYTPTKQGKVLEYMEVAAERTIYQFMLSAESINIDVSFHPMSRIIRVATKLGKVAEVNFELSNHSSIPIEMSFEKVCELQGRVNHSEPLKSKGAGNKSKEKKNNHKEVTDETSKEHKKTVHSIGELSHNEILSVEDGHFSVNKDL